MNEVILTSLLFFIKKLLELVNIKKLQHQRIMQSSFWYIRFISITSTQFVQTCSLQFFFLAVHSLLVSGYGLNLFQLRHAQLINMAGTAPKPASAKTHSTAIATQDQLTSANARMATSIRHFAKQVTPHFFQNFPYQIFFNYFLYQKNFFLEKKNPTWHVFRAAYQRCVLDRRAALLTQQQIV